MTLKTMTLGDLCISPFNVRTNQVDANAVEGMAESLLRCGQLYPLTAHPMPVPKGAKGHRPKAMWGVLAGGRRLRAFEKLVREGQLPEDHPIDVIVREGMTEEELVDLSLAENIVRRDLRPYEVFAAVHRASRNGRRSLEEIARTNGQTIQTVRQWARLGALHPDVFCALERGEISQDQAKAFAATEDQALQLWAFETIMRIPGSDWQRAPDVIRKLLKVGDQEQRKWLNFVGDEAYRDAGGRFELDLFADQAQERGRVADEGLLMQLVEAKLEAKRAELRRRAGRELRFENAYPRDERFGGTDLQLEIHDVAEDLGESDHARRITLQLAMETLEDKAQPWYEKPETPERAAAIAAIDADYVPMERELSEIDARRSLDLPEGDIFGTLVIEPSGELEIRWWWASRKARRAAEKGGEPAAAERTIPPGQQERPSPAPTGAQAMQPYQMDARMRADAAIKDAEGLTQEGIQILRSMRRMLLRAALFLSARQGENPNVGRDYLIWSLARDCYGPGQCYAHDRGIDGFAHSSDTVPPSADAHVQAMPACIVWSEPIEQLRQHESMTQSDLTAAFRAYLSEDEQWKTEVAALVAGSALKRTANAEGYLVPLHDFVAGEAGFASDAMLRTLVEPTEELVELLPKAQRLAFGREVVDAATARNWDKFKAGDLVAPVTRALKGASAWVHPLLRFPFHRSAPGTLAAVYEQQRERETAA